MQDIQSFIYGSNEAPISLTYLLIALLVGSVFSLAIQWHYRRYGSTLSNREELAKVFPFVLLTTVLIISIVKSSLALSLGLVGALSIVRFRTPIKEPEELGYLFFSIAVGLGLGAGQLKATIVSALLILILLAVFREYRRSGFESSKGVFLSIDWNIDKGTGTESIINSISEIVTNHTEYSNLRRCDVREQSVEATFFLCINGVNSLDKLIENLRETYPGIGVSFLDQSHFHGI